MEAITLSQTEFDFLKKLGIKKSNNGTSTGLKSFGSRTNITSFSPVSCAEIASVSVTTKEQYNAVIAQAEFAFKIWREIPAPKRLLLTLSSAASPENLLCPPLR